MIFITAQPYYVMEHFVDNDEYYAPCFDKRYTNGEGISNKPIEELIGYTPIFLSSIDNVVDRLITQTVACPSKAECLVIFKTEIFDKISLCKWLQYIYNKDVNFDISYQVGMEPEYVVKVIRKSEIIKIIPFENKARSLKEQIQLYKRYILTDHFAKQVFPNDSKCLIESYLNHNQKKYLSSQKRFYRTFRPNFYNDQAFEQLRKDFKNLFR